MDRSALPDIRSVRYEIKYILNPSHVFEFERWLLSRPHVNRSFPSRTINSVYFDTAALRAAQDNIKGIANRKKFRVRWYGSLADSVSGLVLEVKIKTGRLGTKHSATLTQPLNDLLAMSAQQIEVAFHNDDAVRDLIPHEVALLPVLYIGYSRQYYEAPSGIRITIDSRLEFSDLFHSHKNSLRNRAGYDKTIVEFKFPVNAKDDAAELMASLPFYPVRCSKYLLGLSLTGNAVYI